MRSMKSVSAWLVICLSFASSLSAAEWKDLLPKNDLSKNWKTEGNWKIDNKGVVSLVPREGESGWTRYGSYLWLNGEYDDFECEFEYAVEANGNSGFYFNVGDRKDPVKSGIEVQIFDSGSKPADAKLTDHDSGGIIPGIPPTRNTAKPAGDWNKFLITVKGDTLNVKLNGETVNEIKLDHPNLKGKSDKGAISFQDHGMPLKLRKIRIRSLE
jgi:3-keto-disaccharide hydrolase